MALKRYEVTIRSRRNEHKTIMKLTPEEAESLDAVEYVKGKQPANKSRSVKNKGGGAARSAAKSTEPSTTTQSADQAAGQAPASE